jgi:beta-glucosidase/6-phospho-beta-glucosidase/beta-galactosidase
MSYRSRQ